MKKYCECGQIRVLSRNIDPRHGCSRCPVKRGHYVIVNYVPPCHRNLYEQSGRFYGGVYVLPFRIRWSCFHDLTETAQGWLWRGPWDSAPIGSKWHKQAVKEAQPKTFEKKAERVAEPSVRLESVGAS